MGVVEMPNKMYFAEVRKIDGPDKAGYVQVRKYGYDNEEEDIKDKDLQWAIPLQPVTSAATGKVGISPVGLRVGSRVVIAYMENDSDEKHPVILGSFARASPPLPAKASSPSSGSSADDTTKALAKQAALDRLNANPNAVDASVSVKLSDGSTYTSTVSR
jgi:hypothetical protein